MTTAVTVTVDCPRCGDPMPVAVSIGPGLDTGQGHEVLLNVDELEQGEHYLTCTTRLDADCGGH